MKRIYVVESKHDRFQWEGAESRGVCASGYTSDFFLHLLELDEDRVLLDGSAWICRRSGGWEPWKRGEPWSGRWTLQDPASVADGQARWWFSLGSPKAHWPGIKTLRSYNPLTRGGSDRNNPIL